jgi:mannose-6-phosphate isomerase-like protein (cupin superfamily)
MTDQLPGGVGVTRLTVYPGSGTPHLHLCCAEAYVVTGGSGSVQTLTLSGYAETPLHDGAVVWFTPGTIHRLINEADLRIVVLMQNSGLPEAGDAVFTFPPEVLGDRLAYLSAAAYPADDAAAFTRRDLAVRGFEVLRAAAVEGDFGPLRAFHAAAVKLVSPHVPEWRRRWANGALRMAQATGSHLDSLAAGVSPHFAGAAVFDMSEPTEHARRGMCGLLDTYTLSR